ncbi:uncharacterized protein B0P05DRAFT_530623 [Gilbertella persicaria]|uniref:uncharacterized protein n=2 Tax=Gilbertella persicaria TaxID=101096 RepID=UPI00221FB6EB|nr:uncharacterized protein B0P05DRAFT_530623 [Gilbertella persicaria]KAI8087910.1 hypothetical protein B0P05DRAFT_530623 [Gilbertella persicaria]
MYKSIDKIHELYFISINNDVKGSSLVFFLFFLPFTYHLLYSFNQKLRYLKASRPLLLYYKTYPTLLYSSTLLASYANLLASSHPSRREPLVSVQ